MATIITININIIIITINVIISLTWHCWGASKGIDIDLMGLYLQEMDPDEMDLSRVLRDGPWDGPFSSSKRWTLSRVSRVMAEKTGKQNGWAVDSLNHCLTCDSRIQLIVWHVLTCLTVVFHYLGSPGFNWDVTPTVCHPMVISASFMTWHVHAWTCHHGFMTWHFHA